MARPAKRPEIEDITDIGEEALALIDELIEKYQDTADVCAELRTLKVYAQILAEKPAKIARLRDFKGYKFAIINENGEPRKASYDESLRLIMGYQHGNVIDIYKQWTVVDGKWVKRPDTNPDGSPVSGA